MIFTQQVNFNNMGSNQEHMKICAEHPGCNGCPLKDNDMNLQGSVVRCETGRAKKGIDYEQVYGELVQVHYH